MRKIIVLLIGLTVISCSKEQDKTLVKSDALALKILHSHIPKWEGNTITDHPADRGGLTNSGLTYNTYLHLKDIIHLPKFETLDKEDIKKCIHYYYKTTNAYRIKNAKIAALLTEFYWGRNTVVRRVADFYGFPLNGRLQGYSLSVQFIHSVNNMDLVQQEEFIDICLKFRENYYLEVASKISNQKVFLKGWLNRNNDLQKTLSKINYHVVEKDETLYSISKKYNMTVDELKSINSITNDIIYLNSIIYVLLEGSTNTNVD